MWCLQMVSRWLEPEPILKEVVDTPSSYNPDAPSFADMKRQVNKKTPATHRNVFVTRIHHNKPL